MQWLNQQFTAWQEIVFACLMLALGLWLEDAIDRYRGRKGNGKR